MHGGKYFSTTTYFDQLFNAHMVKILPGEYHATADGTIITTILGSCVSVCLYDSSNGIGGMNHFMLPGKTGGNSGGEDGSARYGIHAMELLLEHVIQLGAAPARLEAKIFGAGRVMEGMSDVGKRNSEFARHYMKEKKIEIRAVDVGNVFPRKLCFFPATGQVFVKRIKKQELSAELFAALGSKAET